MTGRLLVSRRCDLSPDGDGHEPGRDDEHEAEVRRGAGRGSAEPLDRLLEALRAAEGRPRRLRHEAEDESRHDHGDEPGRDDRSRQTHREPGLATKQEGPRL
jgi:hypothetical protein